MGLLVTAGTAGVAIALALIVAIYAVIYRARMVIPRQIPDAPVTLVLPATGPLPELEALFDALLAQTLRPARLIVAVESRDDPAHDRVAELAGRYPTLAIELVIAGVSDERAQKCTNILGGLAQLGPSDAYVVLFDADIRPQPWWLAALVMPLAAGGADIVNGYRWQCPRMLSLASLLGAGIDRGIATLLRFDRFRLLWGGSLALTRRALDLIDAPTSLARALTEDLVIADRATALGLRIVTRRALRLPTPMDGTLYALWRFGRRQYQIVHVYRPGLWVLTLGVCTADLAARAGLLVAAAASGGIAQSVAVGALIGLGLLGSLTTELRRAVGCRLGVADPTGFAPAQHLLVWAMLPVPAFHASIVWSAARRSPVTWAHVRYTVRRGRVVAAQR